MTDAVVRAGRRYLPRGWADLGRQLLIWFGFLLVYQIVRGFADRSPAQAFHNGLRVISFETNVNALYELTFQRFARSAVASCCARVIARSDPVSRVRRCRSARMSDAC